MSEATSREEDLGHMEANLDRLFRIALESLEKVSRALKGEAPAPDLSAEVALAEHLKDTIYSEALFFIAKWQPLGRILLYVESIIKVSYDLFRVSRYANEIALTLSQAPDVKLPEVVLEASETSREMVMKAYRAFRSKKPSEARGVEELDSRVDEAYRAYTGKITSSDLIRKEDALAALILRQIERVADHATYIARETIRALGGGGIAI
ncbi:MAG: phosphate uptake regulator PhoU [Desulfurococcales archaeon]|nr:phosphate uptake regulator PhoU [Desulfurococcales archaeon]